MSGQSGSGCTQAVVRNFPGAAGVFQLLWLEGHGCTGISKPRGDVCVCRLWLHVGT